MIWAVSRAREVACVHGSELAAGEPIRSTRRLLPARVAQWDVRLPLYPLLRVPLRLAVAHQVPVRHAYAEPGKTSDLMTTGTAPEDGISSPTST